MSPTQAIQRLRDVIRRQLKALATEWTYVYWLSRYMAAIRAMPETLSGEPKLERFGPSWPAIVAWRPVEED